MNRKERVERAIAHQETDVVPWQIYLTIPQAHAVCRAAGCSENELDDWLGNHLFFVEPLAANAWVEVKPGYWRDEFGVVWNRTVDPDIGIVSYYPLRGADLAECSFPDPQSSERWEHFEAQLERRGDRYVVCSIGFSLFERAWTLYGMEPLLVDMIERPAFVEALLDRICDYNVQLVQRACQYDIDAVYFGDDWGQQRGLIMGPRLWRHFLRPRLERMYGAAREAGKRVFIHSCGDVDELFPQLIEIGVDVFNPFQPEVMDIYAVKKQFGGQLTFLGGMSVQQVLPFGTPEQVVAEAHRLMEEIGHGGGYIIAPSHSIPRDVPLENVLVFIRAVRDEQ